MLNDVFIAILVTSFVGTALTLILMLFKPITKKCFSGSWHYYIWLIVLIVMLLPVRITIPEQAKVIPVSSENLQIIDNNAEENSALPLPAAEQDLIPLPRHEAPAENSLKSPNIFTYESLKLVSWLWLCGVIISFLCRLVSYVIFLVKIRKNSKQIPCPALKRFSGRKIITRSSSKITSPLMTGLFKPVLLLPEMEMTALQLDNILMHEMTHFKRKDILYKWFVMLAKCIHWFNPVIYCISKQINMECEISCDLAVTRNMSKEQEISYINTIIDLLAAGNTKAAALSTTMTGDKATLKRRFSMIKNRLTVSKKTMIISVVIAIVILSGTIFVSGIINGNVRQPYENIIISLDTDARENDNFNFLIIGVDENNSADTIMLLSFKDGSVTGTSIPRDTAFISKEFDGKVKLSKILNSENGNQKVIDAVKNTLSVPITYYAKLNLSAVKEIVDSVGGIEFDVPMDMEYDDPYKNLHIKLKQGRQTLSGDAASSLLRFRRSNDGTEYVQGDMTRIEVGQQFISEFINQKLNREFINKSPEILKILVGNMETNYPVSDLMNDIKLLEKMKSNIEFRTINGTLTADETGIVFYDINNGEVVSAASEPKLIPDNTQKKNKTQATVDVAVNEQEEVVLEKIEFDAKIENNPVEGEVSLNFGKREHPITKEVHEHNGVDIKAPEGTDVVSSIHGTVTDVGFDSKKGNYIVVENDNIKTLYAQLATTNVKKGDKISAKQSIGTVGKTGTATGAHLHYEVMVDDEYVDPAAFIK